MSTFAYGQDMPPGRILLKVQECDKLNKTIRDTSNTALAEWVRSIEGTGFIKFDLEKMQNNGDLDSIKALLGMSSPNSFTTTNETISLVDTNVTFVTTQQYYNGIYVEGGGYVQGLINCVTFFMNAYIMGDINIGLTPFLTKQQAISSLQDHELGGAVFVSANPEDDVQLVIDRDLTVSCDYVLAWKMDYRIGNLAKTAFVNANDGSIYKEVWQKRELNAPTVDYGSEVTLEDFKFPGSSVTQLRTPTNSVRTFDKSNTNEAGLFSASSTLFDPSLLPLTLEPTTWPITGIDGHVPEVYQAHHVTASAINALSGLGLAFPPTIYVAGNVTFNNAGFFQNIYEEDNSTIVEDAVYFGRDMNNKSLALFEIAGHELTHMSLHGKFSHTGELGGIEEAFCDIFGTYSEHIIKGSYDWVVGGDNGLNERNMENPVIPVYFPEIGEEEDVHDIAGPMNRWFTILVDGGTFSFGGSNYVVNGIGIDAAAQIVLSSINFMNSGSDFFDARAAMIAAAELIYGDCSDEVEAVATAWYAVGVGYPAHCKLLVAGALGYCEEYLYTPAGDVDLTLLNFVSGYTYKWIYPLDWHAIGESAPQTYVGLHLRMYEYGYMPNFPRYYTITLKEYDQSNIFLRYRHITIKSRIVTVTTHNTHVLMLHLT